MQETFLDFTRDISTVNHNKSVFYIINKSKKTEYISNDPFVNEEVHVKEELMSITKEDEQIVIKYLLDIMKKHDIITEEEYQTVMYKL